MGSGVPTDQRLPQQALWELVRDIRYAMLTTRSSDGRLHSRPLLTLNREAHEDESLWFFVSANGEAAEHLARDNRVGVTYADPGKEHYVSVSGLARLADNRPKRDALWTPRARAWFPQGADDPNLALLEVRIEQAEYWDVHGSRVVQLLQRARAAVTGEPAPPLQAEHREVDFR
ncbi:pyridoxamine 5'-phosphate oxidase family protein [Ideonella sp. BN130291]|uniref:pyridoxamine 5'-phosphate oxidase family protein n=1 Tax=Ideonella sp. BN130291 TaxID=3112940 RepID=UPI002E2602AF|nr:pyridoxamine 5'-phosphate oxidase family protein [Ideonella sp. BN130291]